MIIYHLFKITSISLEICKTDEWKNVWPTPSREEKKNNTQMLEYMQFPDEALYECKSIDKICESQSHRTEIKTNDFCYAVVMQPTFAKKKSLRSERAIQVN